MPLLHQKKGPELLQLTPTPLKAEEYWENPVCISGSLPSQQGQQWNCAAPAVALGTARRAMGTKAPPPPCTARQDQKAVSFGDASRERALLRAQPCPNHGRPHTACGHSARNSDVTGTSVQTRDGENASAAVFS